MKNTIQPSPDVGDFFSFDDLPEGWECKKLGEIISPSKEKIEPTADSTLPYIGLEHIESNTSKIIGQAIASDAKSTKTVFHSGDVLYGKLRPYLNKVAIPDFDGVCSTDILVFKQNQIIDSRYLMRYLTTGDVVGYANRKSKGISLPRVSFENLSEILIPLPPLDEQQRIVARVEAILTHVNAARNKLSRVPLIMKKFRQAVLAAACSGRLTEEWREENPDVECGAELLNKILKERRVISEDSRFVKNIKRKYREPLAPSSLDFSIIPDTWQWATFDQITSLITKGSSPSWQGFDYLDTGIQFVRSQNIQWGNLNLDEIAYLSPKYNEIHQSSIIRENDILLNLVGASIGRSTIATKTIDGANCNQAVGIIRLVDEFLSKKFILFYLLSPHSQDYINDTKSDSARANFNLDDVRPTPVPLPPLAEQYEIVRSVGLLFERADAFDSEVLAAGRRCERLTQAVLGKAFSGKL